ncbi:hypothetical protein ABZY31_07790 [Streptomyces sp. NPDC006529]|uniref:hypothetical protein n=1 Tax=Streptomyces sp. NPDC006529 TaxID=3157177 RepID=UPI0033A526E2
MPRSKFSVRGIRLAAIAATGTALGAGALVLMTLEPGGHASATTPVAAAATATAQAGGASPTPSATAPGTPAATVPAASVSRPAGLPASSPGATTAPTAVHSELVAPSPDIPAGLPLDVRLAFTAGDFRPGGGPGEFSVVLTNRTAKAYTSLDPMLQVIPASGTAFKGALDRFDPTARDWRTVAVPDTDVAPIGASAPTPFTVPAKGSLTIRYRLTLPSDQSAQRTDVMAYAIGSDGKQLGVATGVLPTANR